MSVKPTVLKRLEDEMTELNTASHNVATLGTAPTPLRQARSSPTRTRWPPVHHAADRAEPRRNRDARRSHRTGRPRLRRSERLHDGRPRASLEAIVEGLRNKFIQTSVVTFIVEGITGSGAADYVVVAIGADAEPNWLTNRLFILSAILERSRTVRCIVFTGERDAFLGAASPRDVRADLGARFPEYEQALFRAYGSQEIMLGLGDFRGGNLSEHAVSSIVRTFLSANDIFTYEKPVQLTGWVKLDPKHVPEEQSSWELAEKITASGPSAHSRLPAG